MTIFAVMLPTAQPKVVESIRRVYAEDHLQISDNQWLISTAGTPVDVTAKLGIYDVNNPAVSVGNAIVFATSSYYGRGPTLVWDWIKAKLEGSPGG